MYNPEGESGLLCFQGLDQDQTELSEFGERSTRNHFGEWKSSTTSCMEGIHIGNQLEATCEYLQEAYD